MKPDIDRYCELKSTIHRWDPRIKILSMFILAFCIGSVKNIFVALPCLIISLILVALTRIPAAFSIKRLATSTLFVGPFFIVMPLTMKPVPGDVIYYFSHINFLEINPRGLQLAALVYAKAASIVLLTVPMLGTNRFDISIKALEHLKVPNSVIQMILFTYRYIFVFIAEMNRMITAMRLKRFIAKTNLHTLKTYGNFVGVLLLRSFERTERVYYAMLARGYVGVLKTRFDYQIKAKDVIKAVPILLAIVGIIYFDKFF